MPPFDVLIPAHHKDFGVLRHAVRATLRHVSPVRRILVVSDQHFDGGSDRVSWIDEQSLAGVPSLDDVRARWAAQAPQSAARAPWVWQQLLKLGAKDYVADLSDQYLVIDSDVVFLRPVSFKPEPGKRFPYSLAYEYNAPYRDAYERLFGRSPAPPGHSLTAHHMLYDVALMDEMFDEIEQRHGKPWHEAYVDAVDFDQASSISEMDIYGWWVRDRHPELAYRRQLVWRDVRLVPGVLGRAMFAADFDFVAAHAWARQTRRERFGAGIARIAAEIWAGTRRRAPWTSS
jgi:hypothetical protein